MPDKIDVPISPEIFARLQRLAIPLVDDTNSVIEKLINHWEASPPNAKASTQLPNAQSTSEVWRSPRGDVLPVGATLQAEYLAKTFRATVEKKGIRLAGKVYENLSAAGVAAKGQLGREGRTASTNGRDFWKIQDPVSGRWLPIKALRPSHGIDANALLAELANS